MIMKLTKLITTEDYYEDYFNAYEEAIKEFWGGQEASYSNGFEDEIYNYKQLLKFFGKNIVAEEKESKRKIDEAWKNDEDLRPHYSYINSLRQFTLHSTFISIHSMFEGRLAIDKNRARITSALRRMSDEEITPADYRDIKNLYEPEIEKLLKRKQELKLVDDNLINYINTVTKGLRTLPVYYQAASLSTKQRIISSIYPEKLVYENRTYRTPAINEAVRIISKPEAAFSGLEKGQVSKNGDLSNWVVRLGFEPRLTESESVVLPLHHRTFYLGVQC